MVRRARFRIGGAAVKFARRPLALPLLLGQKLFGKLFFPLLQDCGSGCFDGQAQTAFERILPLVLRQNRRLCLLVSPLFGQDAGLGRGKLAAEHGRV